jgi:hypothetical protein
MLDAGAYIIFPKKGWTAPGFNDNFLVKFTLMEIESDFTRTISGNLLNMDLSLDPLEITVNAFAERPVINFELPPSSYRDIK